MIEHHRAWVAVRTRIFHIASPPKILAIYFKQFDEAIARYPEGGDVLDVRARVIT
jgi:hypothetical protein